jgi:hypothetical protein
MGKSDGATIKTAQARTCLKHAPHNSTHSYDGKAQNTKLQQQASNFETMFHALELPTAGN